MLRRRGFSSKRGEKGFVKRMEYKRKMCFAGSAVGVVVLVEVVTAVEVAGRVAIGEECGRDAKGMVTMAIIIIWTTPIL